MCIRDRYDSYEICSIKKCCLREYYWGKPRLYSECISVPMDEDECWIPRNVTTIRKEIDLKKSKIDLKKSELLRQQCPHGVPLFVDCREGEKPSSVKCSALVKKKDKRYHQPEYGYRNVTVQERGQFGTPLYTMKHTRVEKQRFVVKDGYYEEFEVDVPCETGKSGGKAWFEDEKIKELKRDLTVSERELIVSDLVTSLGIKIPVKKSEVKSKRRYISEDLFQVKFDLDWLACILSESGIMDRSDVLLGRKDKLKCELNSIQDVLMRHSFFANRTKFARPKNQLMH